MEFGLAVLKLSHHAGNSLVYRGMIRTVTRDKLQDDRGKCIGRKFSVWDLHRWRPILNEVLRGESRFTLSIVVIIRDYEPICGILSGRDASYGKQFEQADVTIVEFSFQTQVS